MKDKVTNQQKTTKKAFKNITVRLTGLLEKLDVRIINYKYIIILNDRFNRLNNTYYLLALHAVYNPASIQTPRHKSESKLCYIFICLKCVLVVLPTIGWGNDVLEERVEVHRRFKEELNKGRKRLSAPPPPPKSTNILFEGKLIY